jgi:hypothetical protein
LTWHVREHILSKNIKNIFPNMTSEWSTLKAGLFFTVEDVAVLRGISIPSAHVLCSRYVRRGLFIRVKRNFYILERNWERYGKRDFFRVCNFLQVPSYVSLMTALCFHGVSTQVQRNWYESVSTRKSFVLETRGVSFRYQKVRPQIYGGFVQDEGVFIATPEKAFLDAVYLNALGRYPLDWASLDLGRLGRAALSALMGPYPERVKTKVREALAEYERAGGQHAGPDRTGTL